MKTRPLMDHFTFSLSIVVVLHLTAVLQPSSVRAAELRTVALTGQPAPGAHDGAVYGSFGSYVVEDFVIHGVVLNDAGQVAFRANLTGDDVDSANDQGVWSEGTGSLALVARTGNQAPGAPSGVNFSRDPALEIFSPVINDAGQTAFYGATTDGGLGFWSEGSGSLAPVARSGGQAPGTPSGVNFTFANLYEFLDTPVLNNAGQTSFRSYLSGPGVNSGNNIGLWSEGTGTVALVVREGNPAPGLPGVSFASPFEAGLNDAGQMTFFSYLRGSGVNSSNDRSLWSDGSGSMALVVRTGDPAPGMPDGVTIDRLTNIEAINNVGQVAFHAGLSSEDSVYDFNEGLWLEDSGSFTLLALRGTQAPGMPSGVLFEAVGAGPVLNDAGQVLSSALLTGPGVDSSNDVAGYLTDKFGNVMLIGRNGDPAPGTPAGTILANPGVFHGVPMLNNAGQFAYSNGLAGPGVDSTNDFGIWASDLHGQVHLIARKGDQIEVAVGDSRTVSDLSFVGGNSTSNGWPSSFNNLGQLAFWASFTDGSEGVFVSNTAAHLAGDFNGDGTVDGRDFLAWQRNPSVGKLADWEANFGVAASLSAFYTPIPEPTGAKLLVLEIAFGHWRRN